MMRPLIMNWLKDISEWMSQNHLKMNSGKTEFMYFESSVQLSKCKETAIKVCEDKVERISHIHCLGTWLNEQFSMKHHITPKCRTAMFNIQ